jgi:hypothetical protein
MELPVILTTALNQVREFLQVDRLVIYQFEESATRDQGEEDKGQGTRRQGESPQFRFRAAFRMGYL